jgi:tRNA(adenine34) deaminase
MGEAIAIAHSAVRTGDVPVGAIVLNRDGIVIGIGSNEREANNDPTAHAEIVAIRNAASRLQNSRLDSCTLVVTLEPCAMCAGALVQARMGRVVYGARDPKRGALGSCLDLSLSPTAHHRMEVVAGVQEEACRLQLQRWFQQKRFKQQQRCSGRQVVPAPAD